MPTINTGKFTQADTAGMEAESTKTTIWRHDTKAGAGDIGYTVTAQTEKEEIPRFRLTIETGGAIGFPSLLMLLLFLSVEKNIDREQTEIKARKESK